MSALNDDAPTKTDHDGVGGDVAEEDTDDAVIGTAIKLSVTLLVGIAVAAGVLLAVQAYLEEPPPPAPEIARTRIRTATTAPLPTIPWTDITTQAGIEFVHENGARGAKLLPETMGGGVAFVDYDTDGDADLLLVGSTTWDDEADGVSSLALYQNDGGGQFTDVTDVAGLSLRLYGMGVAVGDYDADGDADLYITALGPNRLLRNDDGRFVDVTDRTNTAGGATDWSTAAGWLDYDADGDLDLVAANYLDWSAESDASQDFRITGGKRGYGRPQNFGGSAPLLFRNDGGSFTEVAEAAGLHVRNPDTGVPAMKSLGLGIDDFDNDGSLDLLIANDTVRNCLFLNQRDGTFREAGIVSGVAYDDAGHARGAMGVDVARFRRGDSLGVVIGNFANEMTALYVDPMATAAFTDEAVASGLGPQTRLLLTFGVLFLDADLDSRLDIVCANGHLDEDISLVQESQTYEQPPQLFWNAGDEATTEFVPLGADQLGDDFLAPMVGRGVAAADIDADGDLDLVLTGVGTKPRLLRNDQSTGHHWLRVAGQPIGTRITVTAGGVSQTRVVNPTRGYLSQSDAAVTFGLGEAGAIDEVTIARPGEQTETRTDVGVDQVIR